ncbi:aldo/keto reductase [Iodidimonas sp. SYSU 1G8]|uniref:aldo/keto reductase n=1 Tax=Iodidimonas sp. SYSU 1G8 TaxID=3133967 RepID=UPI0031FEB901
MVALDHYRTLGRSGLRVSPLCLGAMTFGEDWGWGANAQDSRRMFDMYADRGGNFIDTADGYTQGTSETLVGEFIGPARDRWVIGTKFTMNTSPGDPNAGGNARKNMMRSLEGSLKRLGTDYIDLYWVHVWEFRTPVDEVMRALDDAVRQGKILYAGASNTPAWIVSQANTMAELRGWTPFAAMQLEYNLLERTPERDLLPMCRQLGLATVPWSPLAAGLLTGKYGRQHIAAPGAGDNRSLGGGGGTREEMVAASGRVTEKVLDINDGLRAVAGEVGATPAQVALAWVLAKGVTSPILGARTPAQLEDNLGSLDVTLSPVQIDRLDALTAIELGYPHDLIQGRFIQDVADGGTVIDKPFGRPA